MKVEQKGHTSIIRNTQSNTAEFFQKLQHEYNSFKSQNLIVDLTHDKELTMDGIKLFADLIKLHAKGKKSLVLVSNSVNFNKVPKDIVLVPTILEAHDIIEMEEIERDLEF